MPAIIWTSLVFVFIIFSCYNRKESIDVKVPFCPECEADVRDSANFCSQCGFEIWKALKWYK